MRGAAGLDNKILIRLIPLFSDSEPKTNLVEEFYQLKWPISTVLLGCGGSIRLVYIGIIFTRLKIKTSVDVMGLKLYKLEI